MHASLRKVISNETVKRGYHNYGDFPSDTGNSLLCNNQVKVLLNCGEVFTMPDV
jgi:hypothetical protein